MRSHPTLRAQSSPISFPAQRIILAAKPEAEKSEEGPERHISVLFSPSRAAGDLSYKTKAGAPPTSCTDENIPHPHPRRAQMFPLSSAGLGQQKRAPPMEQRTFHTLFKGKNIQAAHLQEYCKGQRPASCYMVSWPSLGKALGPFRSFCWPGSVIHAASTASAPVC